MRFKRETSAETAARFIASRDLRIGIAPPPQPHVVFRMAHLADIETYRSRRWVEEDGVTPATVVRWRCSCGAVGPENWFTRTRGARNGGARHVAAMERR